MHVRQGLVAFVVACGTTAFAAQAPAVPPAPAASVPVLFRVFMTDGRTLASYGEYATVGDRLVFTMPVGDATSDSRPLVSIPVASVDLARTEAYAEAVRSAQYAASRGPREYDALKTDVSQTLDTIVHTPDTNARLALAEDARTKVTTWEASSHGYRAAEVKQLMQMLDDLVTQLRSAAGLTQFSFDLVADQPERMSPALLPPPTLRESIQMALTAVSVVQSSAERIAILRAALRATEALSATAPSDGDATLGARVARTLAEETAEEHAYGMLIADALSDATVAAQTGDVRAIILLKQHVLQRDFELGEARPDDMLMLLQTLDEKLKLAQLQRLALDHWDAVRDSVERYRRSVGPVLNGVAAAMPLLDAIRDLAGTPVDRLRPAEQHLGDFAATLKKMVVPVDVRAAHEMLQSAIELARQACATRLRAVLENDIDLARNASSAAAGAELLAARAREDLAAQTRAPGGA